MTKDPTQNRISFSRRKVLGGIGTIGLASAGAGLGTSAYFSDTESFDGNQLVAGQLDMKVSWEEHYFYDQDNAMDYAHRDDGELVIDDHEGFMNATLQEQWPDKHTKPELDEGTADPCNVLADLPDDRARPLIDLSDVKPGDFGEVTFDFTLCDNPGYVWLQGNLRSCTENGVTEPEADAKAENEDEPREASLWPWLAAGAAPSSLFDSDAREKVRNLLGKAVQSDSLSRKNVLRAATASTVGAAGAFAASGTASAAIGDRLGEVTMNGADGVGITFDGTYVYAPTNTSSDTIQVLDPPTGDGTATIVATKNLPESIDVIEWDPTRNKFWLAGNGTDQVWLADLGDPTDNEIIQSADFQLQFNPRDKADIPDDDIVDGMAYDGESDTIWFSHDGSIPEDSADPQVWQFNPDGTQATDSPITPEVNGNGKAFEWISGVAAGAPKDGRPTLYLGHNPEQSNGDVIRVYADNGEYISGFAEETGFRVEDIVCDPVTFAPKETLIVTDNDNQYKYYEVEQGTCPIAGQEETCPDVELLDRIQARAWYDKDCDNVLENGEQVLIEGTLREVLTALADGQGLPLDGDESMTTDFNERTGAPDESARDCYSAAEDVHCIGFKWWVPSEVGNEIQSDSVTFDLGFYTEQCRHNDGSGTN